MHFFRTVTVNFLILLLYSILPIFEEPVDTFMLQSVDVVAPIKLPEDASAPYSSSTFGRVDIENRHLMSLKELTSLAPNFYQPDYGSRMTSSIYVRGFGSRIDQPMVGMNVDEMPVMNKNNYDFDFFDIAQVQVLRGAQSVLYGRNTVGGAINIQTVSPLMFQGKRLLLEYGNENTIRVKASHYASRSKEFGWGASIYYSHNDGFFRNSFRREKCDGGDNVAARIRYQWLPLEHLSLDNAFMISYADEGGYAYRAYDATTKILAPVSYNDACTYRRFSLSDVLTLKLNFDDFTLSSVTSYQYINDRMRMDNDFLPLDYFTLGQYQQEHSLTQEFMAKSSDEKAFKWLAGLFTFFKHQRLDAPVLFKKRGIDELILDNVNSGLNPDAGYKLEFQDDYFPIEDKFTIPSFGTALYGQASYDLWKFTIAAGLRIDYEYSSMDYNSYAGLSYKYKTDSDTYKYFESVFKGGNNVDALEFLPRLSVTLNHGWGVTYFSASKGFKAGGFNTQLFSDILRDKLAVELASDMWNRPSDWKGDASITIYRPEESYNYELGTKLSPFADDRLQISASLFFIDCRNQQLTVFPKGKNTGRMMTNAGKSHSYGGELSIRYKSGRVILDASYGYAHATFKEYISGRDDYSGNSLPLAPRETVSANIAYKIPVSKTFANRFVLNLGWNGVGRIYWDEANSLTQAFYGLWNASLLWEKGHFGTSVWGKNLLGEEYKVFYFKSMENTFFAQGKPLQMGVSLYINL